MFFHFEQKCSENEGVAATTSFATEERSPWRGRESPVLGSGDRAFVLSSYLT